MKRFNKVIENSLKDSQLVRVKLKVDPANCSSGEILKYNGYEGYILAEKESSYSVYVEDLGLVAELPKTIVAIQDTLNPIEKLKINALQFLINKGLADEILLKSIYMASTPEYIDAFLREKGMSDFDILSVYRNSLFC
jgi:ribosomal protein L21E